MSAARTERDLVVVLDDVPDLSVGIDLRRHVPRLALEWDDDADGRRWQQVDASLVFADISGFTALTEKLATRGRIGAEELIETLNRVFGAMLEQAAIRGGELLKFGGDALLFVFRGDDHPFRACRSAVDMRQALREAARIPTSVGRLRLSMSVGIHSGPVDFFLVGAPTRELLILGPAATATAEAEHAATAGEILLTADTAAHLPPRSTAERDDGLHRLRWRFTYPPEGEGPPAPEVTQARLRTLFPVSLGEYLDTSVPDPEHKVATIGFARFSGTDTMLREQGHDAVADALHGTLTVVEEALVAEGVTLLATDLDSDGGKLFMGSGVPYSSEDDEGRMLRAMRRVLDVGTPLPMQIGVNRGHVFAAEVGTPHRSAYSAMGDTTNTAARIMSKAPAGVMFAHPTVLEQSRTLFATEPAGPFPMKGKTVPVLVHSVGEEVGTRASQHAASGELVGRDAELAHLREVLARGLSGEGAVITVSAATGLGKSRLVREALAGTGAAVTTVRAEPYGMTSPYRMLRDPVRAAFGVQRGEPDVMARDLLDAFRRLMPDQLAWAPLLSDVVQVPLEPTPEAAAIEPRFRPDRIADLLVRLVEATVPGPFVLLVEEGHWADSASIAVLRRLADAVVQRPWALVVARRDEGEGFEPEGERIVLAPLPTEVMRRFALDVTADAPLRDHEIDGLVARSQGNPLFLQELVRVFREVGSLDDVPESLHAALDTQIDALDPHARRVLRYSAVLGRSFRRAVLDETLHQEDLVLDASTLDRLSSFLEPDGRDRLRFRNSMIRDAAYDGLAYRLRSKLHAVAGRAVEQLSLDLEADADTLSLHFWRGGDPTRTWRYARMAGDRAAQAYANVDAAVQYERALEAGRGLPDVRDSERLALWSRLGEVRELAGMYEAALDAFRAAGRYARDDIDATTTLLLRRARTRQRIGSYGAALRDIAAVEKLVDGRRSLAARRARVRARSLRTGIRLDQERLADALVDARGVIAEARKTGEIEALEQALIQMDTAAFQLGDTSVGEATREALRICVENGHLQRASVAQVCLGGFAFYTGRWDDAVESFAGGRAFALAVGDLVGAAMTSLSLGEVLVDRGELDEGESVLVDAVRTLRVSGAHTYAAYGQVHVARARLARGDIAGAERLAEEVELELAALGQRVSALEATLVRAEALCGQDRFAEALDLVEVSADAAKGEGVALAPRVHLERARALTGLGRLDDAVDQCGLGLELARSYGLPYEEALLLQVSSDAHARRGDDADATEAAQSAEAILRRLRGAAA